MGERVAGEPAPGRGRRPRRAARSRPARPRSRAGRRRPPTWAWFLAEARTIAGPPMSISSIPGLDGERVEVDDDERDRLDPVGRHVGPVLGLGRVGEQPAVDLRVERDDAVVEDRRNAGQFGDVGDGHARVGDRLGGPAARHDPPAKPCNASARSPIPALSYTESKAVGTAATVPIGQRGRPRSERNVSCGQRAATIAAIRSPASVGFRPTWTPAARRASILPWAVPLPPQTIAPAWPIFLPAGAVTPAM